MAGRKRDAGVDQPADVARADAPPPGFDAVIPHAAEGADTSAVVTAQVHPFPDREPEPSPRAPRA